MSIADYLAISFLCICTVASISVLFLFTGRLEKEEQNHIWRPALTSKGPARTCICGTTEQLTTAEFYAQFGIMPNVGIIAK